MKEDLAPVILQLPVPAKNNLGEQVPEEIVIYDECGDTLWDKVFAQEERIDLLKKIGTGKY